MWFKKRFVRKKLRELQVLKDSDPMNQRCWKTLEVLMFDLPEGLFKDYEVKRRGRLELVSIHRNIEGLLNILDDSLFRVVGEMSVSRKALSGDDDAIVVTLDEWLETSDNYPVKPQVAWDLLHERSVRLLNSISECERPAFITVHRRKHTYVFLDTIVAMEALLNAAL